MGGHYDFAFMTLTFYRIVQWKSVIKHQNILVRFIGIRLALRKPVASVFSQTQA